MNQFLDNNFLDMIHNLKFNNNYFTDTLFQLKI